MAKERNFLIHPSYIIMFLLLAGITALFLGFSAAYLYNRIQQGIPPVKLPSMFYWNTLLLIFSSISLIYAKNSYKKDQTESYKYALLTTFVLTILFLIAQVMAWMQLQNQDIFIHFSNMAAYLYVISGLHFLHVLAGVPFLFWFVLTAFREMKSPVSVLLYFSDVTKKRKLQLLNIYWHFLDLLWIYLVVFFLANYLIQ